MYYVDWCNDVLLRRTQLAQSFQKNKREQLYNEVALFNWRKIINKTFTSCIFPVVDGRCSPR